jgi:spermidine synthase
VVLLGQAGPTEINVEAMDRLLARPEMAPVAASLEEIGLESAAALLSTYVGRASDLEDWLRDAEINRDDNLRLQFLAGFGMNIDEREDIHRGMVASRRYPDGVFVGSPSTLRALREDILGRTH